VKSRITQRALALTALFCGCNGEGDSYVFLSDLCATYAEDVCSARTHCCDGGAKSCEAEVTAECASVRGYLVAQDGLVYNASYATDVRERMVGRVSACEGPIPVSAFFTGTAQLGDACTDDRGCASGHCEIAAEASDGTCAEAAQLLCPAP